MEIIIMRFLQNCHITICRPTRLVRYKNIISYWIIWIPNTLIDKNDLYKDIFKIIVLTITYYQICVNVVH